MPQPTTSTARTALPTVSPMPYRTAEPVTPKLLTGQNHHAEAKIACRRFVQRRLALAGVRFSHEKVRDLSSVRQVVTGTARAADRPATSHTCTVSHTGAAWVLDGMTGV